MAPDQRRYTLPSSPPSVFSVDCDSERWDEDFFLFNHDVVSQPSLADNAADPFDTTSWGSTGGFPYDAPLSTSEPIMPWYEGFLSLDNPQTFNAIPTSGQIENSIIGSTEPGNDMLAELAMESWDGFMLPAMTDDMDLSMDSSYPAEPSHFDLNHFPQGWAPQSVSPTLTSDPPVVLNTEPERGGIITGDVSGDRKGAHTRRKQRGRASSQSSNTGSVKKKGRRCRPLTYEEKIHAKAVRKEGACESCRRRKITCSETTPCVACIKTYGPNLLTNPCRGPPLQGQLSSIFLSSNVFPKARSLDSYLGRGRYSLMKVTFVVPIKLGMGPSIPWTVRLVHLNDKDKLVHQHLEYNWPPPTSAPECKCSHRHVVFPAILDNNATSLKTILDEHIANLVDNHFQSFPAYESPLRVLGEIYRLYKSLDDPRGSMLHLALKLLIIVHTSGDVTVDNADATVQEIMDFALQSVSGLKITPCFIRSQLGEIMPVLAQDYFNQLLARLTRCSLQQDSCSHWEIILSCIAVSIMVMESAGYHNAKQPYHIVYDNLHGYHTHMQQTHDHKYSQDDSYGEILLKFYHACFSNCHRRLDIEGITSISEVPDQTDANATFVANIRSVLVEAKSYICERSRVVTTGVGDMSAFFDRQLARLFMMEK